MSKRECPFCKEKVKEDAMTCGLCGGVLPPPPPKEWYKTWKGYLLGLFAVMMFSSAIQQNNTRPPVETPEQVAAKKEEMDSIDARTFAKLYVEKSLKAPSTAKWQNVLDFGVSPKKDKKGNKIKDIWLVSGYVDAQNSFGAMVRQQWHVEMKKTNSSWALLDLVFSK